MRYLILSILIVILFLPAARAQTSQESPIPELPGSLMPVQRIAQSIYDWTQRPVTIAGLTLPLHRALTFAFLFFSIIYISVQFFFFRQLPSSYILAFLIVLFVVFPLPFIMKKIYTPFLSSALATDANNAAMALVKTNYLEYHIIQTEIDEAIQWFLRNNKETLSSDSFLEKLLHAIAAAWTSGGGLLLLLLGGMLLDLAVTLFYWFFSGVLSAIILFFALGLVAFTVLNIALTPIFAPFLLFRPLISFGLRPIKWFVVALFAQLGFLFGIYLSLGVIQGYADKTIKTHCLIHYHKAISELQRQGLSDACSYTPGACPLGSQEYAPLVSRLSAAMINSTAVIREKASRVLDVISGCAIRESFAEAIEQHQDDIARIGLPGENITDEMVADILKLPFGVYLVIGFTLITHLFLSIAIVFSGPIIGRIFVPDALFDGLAVGLVNRAIGTTGAALQAPMGFAAGTLTTMAGGAGGTVGGGAGAMVGGAIAGPAGALKGAVVGSLAGGTATSSVVSMGMRNPAASDPAQKSTILPKVE